MILISEIAAPTCACSRALWSDGAAMLESVPMITVTISSSKSVNPAGGTSNRERYRSINWRNCCQRSLIRIDSCDGQNITLYWSSSRIFSRISKLPCGFGDMIALSCSKTVRPDLDLIGSGHLSKGACERVRAFSPATIDARKIVTPVSPLNRVRLGGAHLEAPGPSACSAPRIRAKRQAAQVSTMRSNSSIRRARRQTRCRSCVLPAPRRRRWRPA